jgi:hypothetical protein
MKKKVIFLMKTRSQVARDILEKVFSLYPVHNAWSEVSFGANQNGIHRAAVDDPMHYNASGLFAYLGKIAFGGLKPAEAERIEGFMREDFLVRSSVQYDLPRGKFTAGFTNCTLLTSNEKVGIMHALYLFLGTPCCSILRQQQKYANLSCFDICPAVGVSNPRSSTISKLEDQYFFKKSKDSGAESMRRNLTDVSKMLMSLDGVGLLQYAVYAYIHGQYVSWSPSRIAWRRTYASSLNI